MCVFTCQAYIQRDRVGVGGVPLGVCQLGGQIPDSIDRHIEQIIIKQLIIDPTQIIEKSQTAFVPHLDNRFSHKFLSLVLFKQSPFKSEFSVTSCFRVRFRS